MLGISRYIMLINARIILIAILELFSVVGCGEVAVSKKKRFSLQDVASWFLNGDLPFVLFLSHTTGFISFSFSLFYCGMHFLSVRLTNRTSWFKMIVYNHSWYECRYTKVIRYYKFIGFFIDIYNIYYSTANLSST